ncbi:aspartyl protease family protein At5g10770-like [Silene latifolia]|uniref:aspartyl protease family protein At5g10770-like n=1 Tax=Silene latifolia TaxID=37657 RepID=UPI003D78015C
MTTFNHVITNKFFLLSFLILVTSSCWITNANHYGEDYHIHTTQVSSLLPSDLSSTCNSSPQGRKSNSVRLSHRHGPCSPVDSEKTTRLTHVEILEHDKDRVESIRNRVKPNLAQLDKVRPVGQKTVVLPAKSGSTIGSGNYIVTVGLGTPKKDLSLIFDTGSDFTWTQCAPCAKSCYDQQEPVFDPSQSSTYSNITCSSELCSEVGAATSASPGCSSTTCIYGIQYGDSSFSVGFFAKDTLTLGTGAYVPNFYFGCGENNQGLFGGSAGLLGLGRNKLSVVSQSASTFGSYFSYCLPSKSNSTGHLTFGQGGVSSKVIKYTSLLSSSGDASFYYLNLIGITVAGRKLALSPTVFSTGGTLIDSGTVITRLPPDAYTALQGAFRKAMSKYPTAPALSILDTCYDLSSYTTVAVPKISMLFSGGASLDLQVSGILYVKDLSQVCLAFAGNEDAGDLGIIGNVQQTTFDVVYDVAGGKIGFGAGGCM